MRITTTLLAALTLLGATATVARGDFAMTTLSGLASNGDTVSADLILGWSGGTLTVTLANTSDESGTESVITSFALMNGTASMFGPDFSATGTIKGTTTTMAEKSTSRARRNRCSSSFPGAGLRKRPPALVSCLTMFIP